MKFICLVVDIGIESDNYESERASNYKLPLTLSLSRSPLIFIYALNEL